MGSRWHGESCEGAGNEFWGKANRNERMAEQIMVARRQAAFDVPQHATDS